MNKKELDKFKRKAVKDMPLTKKQKEHILNGNYLHQIHFDKIPVDQKERKEWFKQELHNYFGLRCLGNMLYEESSEDERFKDPSFSDKEFEDFLLLFELYKSCKDR